MTTTGRIKAGEGTLIGNAGEYYVVAELLKRGVIAALAPRNAPAFDILATSPAKTVRIRVKTKSETYTDWQWVVKKDGSIFRYLQHTEDFTVMVNLTAETRNMDYFIVPTTVLNSWLVDDFQTWVSTPGKRGQQRSTTNTKRNLSYTTYKERLSTYRNNWNLLWQDTSKISAPIAFPSDPEE